MTAKLRTSAAISAALGDQPIEEAARRYPELEVATALSSPDDLDALIGSLDLALAFNGSPTSASSSG